MKSLSLIFIVSVLLSCFNSKKADQEQSETSREQQINRNQISHDTLHFSKILKSFKDYNSKKELKIDGEYSASNEMFPDDIIQKLNVHFESLLKGNSNSSYQITRVISLKTRNNWIVYSVAFKNEDGWESDINGSFYQHVNYIFSDIYQDVCSRTSLNRIDTSGDSLKVDLCEYFNCTCDDPSYFKQHFYFIGNDLVRKSRDQVNTSCNSMHCNEQNIIIER